MPHYKCGACRTRFHVVEPSPAPIVAFCPECRSALDHITDLTELIGLRRGPCVDDRDCTVHSLGSFDGPSSAAVAVPRPSPAQ